MGNKSISILLLSYCLSTVLVPVFALNKLLFIPLFFISVVVVLTKPVRTIAPFVFCLVLFYGFSASLHTDSDTGLGLQMLLGGCSLFLIYVICAFDVDMGEVIKITGITLALLMCGLSFMLMVMPGFFIGQLMLDYYNLNELGYYGVRDFGSLQLFMLHHRSSPFLLVPLSLLFLDCLEAKKFSTFFFMGIILGAIFCSASRALIAISILTMFLLYLNHKSLPLRIFILSFSVPVLLVFLSYLVNETSVLSFDEKSNGIKAGHVTSFFNVIDLKMLIIGNGLGSYFFTEGYGALVSQTEITWMDSVRFVGLPLTLLLIGVIFFPAKKHLIGSTVGPKRLVMMMYMIMSMSNPVLFNSFGFLVILWYWSVVIKPLPMVSAIPERSMI